MGVLTTLRELDERVLPFRGTRAQGLERLAVVAAFCGVAFAFGGAVPVALYAFGLAIPAGVAAVVLRHRETRPSPTG